MPKLLWRELLFLPELLRLVVNTEEVSVQLRGFSWARLPRTKKRKRPVREI